MFGTARWRLTLSFVAVLGVILVLTGVVVFLVARAALLDQVDSDLESRLSRERPILMGRLMERGRMPVAALPIGPEFATGGYFYALVDTSAQSVVQSPETDPSGLAGPQAIEEALQEGAAFATTKSSEGDSLRVYVVRLDAPSDQGLFMQVGRSIEPEQQALRRLLLVLIAGGAAGLAMASVGGYALAGIALRPIRAAMDSQRSFVADASHDLRTPLAIVRANAELLKRHELQPVSENHEALDDIIGESDRLGKMVAQMLTLARADAGETVLSMSEVALDEVVDEAARSMRLLADERGVSLETRLNGPVRLRGDAERLRDLTVILTDNAIKYTGAGGNVRLEVGSMGGKALLRVSDTGRGIPAEALPRIFDRFFRVDKARSRESGGTGLGLSIARWIVEAHKGSIRAESEPGKGTTVTVELPM